MWVHIPPRAAQRSPVPPVRPGEPPVPSPARSVTLPQLQGDEGGNFPCLAMKAAAVFWFSSTKGEREKAPLPLNLWEWLLVFFSLLMLLGFMQCVSNRSRSVKPFPFGRGTFLNGWYLWVRDFSPGGAAPGPAALLVRSSAQFVSCCSATQLALKDQNFYISLYFFFSPVW